MQLTIQLRQGDMFAQPTDLIVIPCSTGGTITESIAEQLQEFDIKWPRGSSNLGDVKFELFEGASNLATYVGYATSVEAMDTTAEAIKKIAEKVAKFISGKAEIRDVAIPLLGAGAGGLGPEESLKALIAGFEKVSTDGKVINIYVYRKSDFKELSNRQDKPPKAKPTKSLPSSKSSPPKMPAREPPRVFISYTKTSDDHQSWVKSIATFLRENGIQARLDVWHLRPGMDLPQWMCNELDQADRVLIICNEEYVSKANGRLGGVGWEIRLIQGDLLQSQSLNPTKYLPILRGRFDADSVPAFLKGVYSLTWDDRNAKEVKDQLLKIIWEVLDEAPPIGQPPRFVLQR